MVVNKLCEVNTDIGEKKTIPCFKKWKLQMGSWRDKEKRVEKNLCVVSGAISFT